MVKDAYDGPILEIDKLSISFFTRPWGLWAKAAVANPPWRWG